MKKKEDKLKRGAFYAIIPASVRYDERLTPNAKLLYGEITALCSEKGFCWASNEYFADLYGVSKSSITNWISTLVDFGYITRDIIFKEGSREISERVLKIVVEGPRDIYDTPTQKNSDTNNTSINNTMNTTLNKLPAKNKFSPVREFKPIFESFYKKLKGIAYYWTGVDAGKCKSIYNKIKFMILEKDKEKGCVEKESELNDEILKSFIFMLEKLCDPFVIDHLSMAMFDSKFNDIAAQAKGSHGKKTTHQKIEDAQERILNKIANGTEQFTGQSPDY